MWLKSTWLLFPLITKDLLSTSFVSAWNRIFFYCVGKNKAIWLALSILLHIVKSQNENVACWKINSCELWEKNNCFEDFFFCLRFVQQMNLICLFFFFLSTDSWYVFRLLFVLCYRRWRISELKCFLSTRLTLTSFEYKMFQIFRLSWNYPSFTPFLSYFFFTPTYVIKEINEIVDLAGFNLNFTFFYFFFFFWYIYNKTKDVKIWWKYGLKDFIFDFIVCILK